MPAFYHSRWHPLKHGEDLPHWEQGEGMQSWKGISARRIGQASIWQKNYRDNLVH